MTITLSGQISAGNIGSEFGRTYSWAKEYFLVPIQTTAK